MTTNEGEKFVKLVSADRWTCETLYLTLKFGRLGLERDRKIFVASEPRNVLVLLRLLKSRKASPWLISSSELLCEKLNYFNEELTSDVFLHVWFGISF